MEALVLINVEWCGFIKGRHLFDVQHLSQEKWYISVSNILLEKPQSQFHRRSASFVGVFLKSQIFKKYLRQRIQEWTK